MGWFEDLPAWRPSRWKPGAHAELAAARRAWFAANRYADDLFEYRYRRVDVMTPEQEAIVFQVVGLFDRFAAALMLEAALLWETGAT